MVMERSPKQNAKPATKKENTNSSVISYLKMYYPFTLFYNTLEAAKTKHTKQQL